MADQLSGPARGHCHRFGDFELRPLERELLQQGRATHLGSRAFDLLLVLVERAGHLLTRDELLEAVWRGVIVEENNLEKQISALRRIIGAQAIRTIQRRGYRFVVPVRTVALPCATAFSGGLDSRVIADQLVQVLDAAASFRELARSLEAVRLPAHAEECLDLFLTARAQAALNTGRAPSLVGSPVACAVAAEPAAILTLDPSTYRSRA